MFNSEPKHLPKIVHSLISRFHPGAMAHVPVTNADTDSPIPNSGLQVPFFKFWRNFFYVMEKMYSSS